MSTASHSQSRFWPNRNWFWLIGALAGVACFASASQAHGSFASATNFGVGEQPVSVAIADLDGDGDLDLTVANDATGNVSVLLGNGNGSFAGKTDFPAGTRPQSVAVRSLNGDGFPDIVVANSGSDEDPGGDVSVLLGNGDGSFGPPVSFLVGDAPSSVAVADLNADRKPDLAVANVDSNNISVLLANANGSFRAARNFAAGLGPSSVRIADLDGDRKPDLVTADSISGTVSTLPGKGDGTFGAASSRFLVSGPNALAIGKLNRDGFPDLAVANYFSDDVSVLLNRQANIGRVTITGPGSLRVGRSSTFTATILNSGNVPATGVKLIASGRGIKATSAVGAIKAGGKRTVKVRLRPIKTGRITASFRAVSGTAGSKTVRKVLRVR